MFCSVHRDKHLSVAKDEDSVSVNSTASANSEGSEDRTDQVANTSDQINTSAGVDTSDNKDNELPESNTGDSKDDELPTSITGDNAVGREDDAVAGNVKHDSSNLPEVIESKTSDIIVSDSNMPISTHVAKRTDVDSKQQADGQSNTINQKHVPEVLVGTNSSGELSVPLMVVTDSGKKKEVKASMNDAQNVELKPKSDNIPVVSVQEDKTSSAPDERYGPESGIDVELARLESYLSNRSPSPVPGSSPGIGSNMLEADQVLLSAGRRVEMRTVQVGQATLVEDTVDGYTPSSLDLQLAAMETTESHRTDPLSPPTSITPQTSTNYSIYDKPADDIYSSNYQGSSLSSLPSDSGLDEDQPPKPDWKAASNISAGPSEQNEMEASPRFLRFVNNWTEVTAKGNIYSLAVSASHVWVTDRGTNIYYSSLEEPGVTWRKSTGNASQISVSPDGNIVWALHKGTVSAGTRITAKRPEGMKWVEAVRDVAYVCVDNTCAW